MSSIKGIANRIRHFQRILRQLLAKYGFEIYPDGPSHNMGYRINPRMSELRLDIVQTPHLGLNDVLSVVSIGDQVGFRSDWSPEADQIFGGHLNYRVLAFLEVKGSVGGYDSTASDAKKKKLRNALGLSLMCAVVIPAIVLESDKDQLLKAFFTPEELHCKDCEEQAGKRVHRCSKCTCGENKMREIESTHVFPSGQWLKDTERWMSDQSVAVVPLHMLVKQEEPIT